MTADALALTFTIVVAVGNEVVTWISTLFIPYFMETSRRGEAAAAVYFRRCLVVVLATGTLAALLVVLGRCPGPCGTSELSSDGSLADLRIEVGQDNGPQRRGPRSRQ